MADDIVYSASLDDRDVIKSLKNIDRQIDKTASDGAKSFDKLAKSVKSFTTIELASKGFSAFERGAEIVQEFTAVAAAAQAAQVNLAFSANAAAREFGTSVGTATTWKNTIEELRGQLKLYSEQELTEAATKTVDMSKRLGLNEAQMVELIKRTADLSAGKYDLNQAVTDVTSAIRGEAEASEKYGLSLSEPQVRAYAEAQGLVWKELSDTEKYQLRYNLLLEQTNELQGRAAEYANTLAGAQQALNAQLADQKVLIGEQLIPLQEGYVALLTQLSGETEDSASIITDVLAFVAASAGTFATVVSAQFTKVVAGFAALGAAGQALLNFENPFTAAQNAVAEYQDEIDSANAVMSNVPAIFQQAFNGIKDGWKEQREGAKQAAEDFANIPPPVIPVEIAVDPAELEKAQEKLTDLEKDFARQNLDTIIDAERKKLDTLQDFAQKRLDLAEKNRDKIEDIDRDLGRDFEDIDREANRKLVDIDRERADTQIDIERDYQRRISDIRRNFEVSAEDAARNRDAVAFLAAQRKRDEELQSAKTDRTQETTDATTEATRRREELALNSEYEREDARLAAERKLEDQRIALQREQEALRQAELQKTLELATELNRRLTDAKRHNAEKLADLMASLSEEVKAVIEAEQAKTAAIQQQRDFRNSLEDEIDAIKERERNEGRTSLLGGRAYGGPVGAGQSVIVGERGPEIFRSSTAGSILPSSPAIMSPLMGGAMSNVSNVSATVNQSMLDPAQQSAIMRAVARNEAVNIMQRFLNG